MIIVPNRNQHRQELLAFLQDKFSRPRWELGFPAAGHGHETYIARSNGDMYFIKLGAHIPHYQVMASLDLTPEVIMTGALDDGTSVLIQPYIAGRYPSWQDYRHHFEKIASVVNKTHHSLTVKSVLPEVPSEQYKDVGAAAVTAIQKNGSGTGHRY